MLATIVLCLGLLGAPACPDVTPSIVTPSVVCVSIDGKADGRCNPGSFNPDVTQATLATTICLPNWTKTVRPSSSFTNRIKAIQMRQYGLSTDNPREEIGLSTEDHIVPLELGGAPRDPANLFPQPVAIAAFKDLEEDRLHGAVCNGSMSLAVARARIISGWVAFPSSE